MLKTSLLFAIGFYLSSDPAWAGVTFIWRADNSVEVGVGRTVLGGEAREGTITELTSDPLNVWILPFSNAFIGVAWAEPNKDQGFVVILERQNSRYYAITKDIRANSKTMIADLQSAVKGLEKSRKWDASIALRAFSAHFAAHKTDTLSDFKAAVEAGDIKTLPRPDRKGLRAPVGRPPKVRHANAPVPIPLPEPRPKAPEEVVITPSEPVVVIELPEGETASTKPATPAPQPQQKPPPRKQNELDGGEFSGGFLR